MLKIDFHIHTKNSPDSTASLRRMLDAAKKRGLSAIAVTDHDSAGGDLRTANATSDGDPAILPGVEFTVPMGEYGLHIIGLFATKTRTVRHYVDAVEQIREQGGVVILPHLCREGTGLLYHHKAGNIADADVEWLFAAADYVEGINYKCRPETTLDALEYLAKNPKPLIAGSDAHIPAEVGLAWTEVDDLAEFKKGRASTRACMLLKGPAPKLPVDVGIQGSIRKNWFADLLIGARYNAAVRFSNSDWKTRLKKALGIFPLSLAGKPMIHFYRRFSAAAAGVVLARQIERELDGSFTACVVILPESFVIEPMEGFYK
jgi:predicted metal-dependent phosphoesterase TrpH